MSDQTDWMLEQAADAVAEGQPRLAIVGMTIRQCIQDLMPALCSKLQERGLAVMQVSNRAFKVDGSTILFTSPEFVHLDMAGIAGCGLFWSELATGTMTTEDE